MEDDSDNYVDKDSQEEPLFILKKKVVCFAESIRKNVMLVLGSKNKTSTVLKTHGDIVVMGSIFSEKIHTRLLTVKENPILIVSEEELVYEFNNFDIDKVYLHAKNGNIKIIINHCDLPKVISFKDINRDTRIRKYNIYIESKGLMEYYEKGQVKIGNGPYIMRRNGCGVSFKYVKINDFHYWEIVDTLKGLLPETPGKIVKMRN